MSEPKLCPYLANTLIIKNETFDGQRLDLAKCLEDKCQMWRTFEVHKAFGTRENLEDSPNITEIRYTAGWCGLAGKP